MNRSFANLVKVFLLTGIVILTSCGSHKKTSENNPKNENSSTISELSKRKEIASIGNEDGTKRVEILSIAQDEGETYFLSVGHLGYGDDFIQVYFDPFHELFIPLGSTLEEVEAMMQQLKDFCKQPQGATMETMGCLSKFFPNDKLEKVTLTHNRLLLNNLIRFSVEREGELRATFVKLSDINSLLSSLKWYRKIHPNK